MAGTSGLASDHLDALATLAAEPYRFSLFAAMRLLERANPNSPRFGESRKAADDPVRFTQPPHLIFAPSDVVDFGISVGSRPRLGQHCFGIMGPNGALPLHLTEYAYERKRQFDDPTVSDFINTFQHRFIELFYRAWANSDPSVNLDRPSEDRFRGYLGALIGLGPPSARDRDAVIDHAKLSRCGLYGPQSHSAEGLETLLGEYFGKTIRIRSYVGEWLRIPEDSLTRLGAEEQYALLGQGATLGGSSWQCQHKFEIVVGPLDYPSFSDFLPNSQGLREMRALVQLYTNGEWAWQVRLLLSTVEVPRVELGKAGSLGWTTWLGTKGREADDVVLQGDDR
jgi:type VI secretion system protein ImpH